MHSLFSSRRIVGSLAPLALLGTLVLSPLKAWAFSAQGHETVADVAELYLQQDPQGQAVLARIQTILDPGETMARASTWADRIKSGPINGDNDSAVFLDKVQAKFGNTRAHNPWHYVDVPFQAASYSRLDVWTRPDDVVQMARICAQTLHDGTSPIESPIELTQREALRLLIHYIGDEHQPLHVGCGYIAKGGTQFVLPTSDDVTAGRITDDQGGNSLTLVEDGKPVLDDRGKPKKLHSYWDFDTVRTAEEEEDAASYAKKLMAVTPIPGWSATGDMATWSGQWADDALRQSKLAYAGITIVSANDRGWDINVPKDYDKTSAALIETQLAKGGYRLAQLLKAALSEANPTAP